MAAQYAGRLFAELSSSGTRSRHVGMTHAKASRDFLDTAFGSQYALAKRSAYFDYDSYTVQDSGRSTVATHAQYFTANKGRKNTIQGNTDERGGTEYNLALGQKRAEAVRKSLSLLGVADSEMEGVSFGKEKPITTGHNEAAWSENHRADIAY